jgi:hypothetical protein
MFVQDSQGNWIDQDINANTNVEIENVSTIFPDVAVPFDHLARLSDKLFGAVGLALDNATAGIQIQNWKNEATYKQLQGQAQVVKLPLGTWIEKNILLLIVSLFLLMMFGIIKK